MKRNILFIFSLLLLFSCNNNKVILDIKCPNLKDSTAIKIKRLALNNEEVLDTFYVKNNRCNISFHYGNENPEFIYVYADESLISPFVAINGEKVKITYEQASYVVDGSPETNLMNQIFKKQQKYLLNVDSLSNILFEAQESENRDKFDEINSQIMLSYINYKKDAIHYLMEHLGSITSIPVLYQKLNNNIPLFNIYKDFVYFEKVYENLKTKYPNSPYVQSLKNDLLDAQNKVSLNNKLAKMKEISFPEIELYDINGELKKLSDLKGKVILLSFWSANDDKMKMYNLDLMELYNRYNASGLEIYQVSPNVDKNTWASVVKLQDLPWVSVNDPEGDQSKYLSSYNVSKIPTLFIINRDGEIIARDVFDLKKLYMLLSQLL